MLQLDLEGWMCNDKLKKDSNVTDSLLQTSQRKQECCWPPSIPFSFLFNSSSLFLLSSSFRRCQTKLISSLSSRSFSRFLSCSATVEHFDFLINGCSFFFFYIDACLNLLFFLIRIFLFVYAIDTQLKIFHFFLKTSNLNFLL